MKTLSAKSKAAIDVVRPEIDRALAEIAKKHGLKELRTAGSASYSNDGYFSFKIEGVVSGGLDKAAALYASADFLKLPPLGTEFSSQGHRYRTAGLNTTGSKVICERTADAKRYLFAVDAVKRLTAAKAKEAA